MPRVPPGALSAGSYAMAGCGPRSRGAARVSLRRVRELAAWHNRGAMTRCEHVDRASEVRGRGARGSRPRRARIVLGLAALTLWTGCSRRDEAHPDVLLVVVDTLRADRLSCYGYPRSTTPIIDRLAQEGVLFEDVTAQFSWTVPSMVSLFSGRHVPDRREILVPEVPALAETLQRAGYRTFASVANQLLDEKGGFGRGFESYDARPSRQRKRRADPEHSRDLHELVNDLEDPLRAALAEERRGGDRRAPFFVYLHAYEPHDPYWPRKRFETELPVDAAVPGWPTPWHLDQLERDGVEAAAEQLADIHRFRAQYDHEVRYVDEQLGAALERFEELGLLEHAVVALVSDHGEGLWDHRAPVSGEAPPDEFFYGEHGAHLYREAIETPLVLWGAGVPVGVRVTAPVENVDLFPTLLELANVALPPGLHGHSLLPLARGQGAARPHVFSFGADGRSCVRETASGLKLVVTSDERLQLFDLASDPSERDDVAAARPDEARRLHALLLEWEQSHGGGDVDPELIRDDWEDVERLLRLGYTELDIGER